MAWDETKHKRGQPKNAGQFGPGGGGSSTATEAPKRNGPTAQQRAAVEWYSGDGWVQLNAALRGENDIHGEAPRPVADFKTTIQHLDAAIDGAGESSVPMKLYRGVRVKDPDAFIRGIETGGIMRMRGYQSTSKDVAVAAASGNVLLRIESSRGLDMSGLTKNPGEREVLLGRDWGYEVVGKERVEFRGREMYAVRLKVVNNAP